MAVTDAQWQASEDPLALLRHVLATTSQRKRLLLIYAAWQQVRHRLTGEPSQRALEKLVELAEAEQAAQRTEDKVRREGAELLRAWMRQKALLSDCIRDIFANPFRPAPAVSPRVRTWNNAAVPRIRTEYLR